MTSGVVLAEKLSAKIPNYKSHVAYVGIDASLNMLNIARWVNEIKAGQKIFEHFHLKKADTFKPTMLNQMTLPSDQIDIAVLCLSYVLSKGTLKINRRQQKKAMEALADSWHKALCKLQGCRETRIIYMNPDFPDAYDNWDHMVSRFTSNSFSGWRYKANKQLSKQVSSLPGPVITQMIKGTRLGSPDSRKKLC